MSDKKRTLSISARGLTNFESIMWMPPVLAQGKRPLRQYVHDHWGVPQGLPQNSAYTLFQSSDGYLWFGTQEGLVRFDGLQFKVIDRTNNKDMRNNWGFPFAEDQRGGIWMMYGGRNQGVRRYANGVFHTVDTTDGLAGNDVRYIRTTRDGSVWIFERSASLVTQYLNGTMKTWRQSDGLPTDSVFSVSEDSKGNSTNRTAGLTGTGRSVPVKSRVG